MVESLLLALTLRIAGLGVQQPDAEQTTGALHPVGAVLRDIVEIDAARNAVLLNALLHCIFYDGLLHIPVELRVDDVTGGIVDQAGQIRWLFIMAVE